LVDHKDYGHKRIALRLKMGHNRIRRVMKKSIILNPTEDAINRGLRRKIWEKSDWYSQPGPTKTGTKITC